MEGKPVDKGGQMKSGRFVLRIPPEVHKRLSNEAQELGISLNQHINNILEESEGKER